MAQASGSSAEISYKLEETNAEVVTAAHASAVNTKLTVRALPGALSITLAASTNVEVNAVLKVGSGVGAEYVEVAAINASTNVAGLDTKTPLNFLHHKDEPVTRVILNTGWQKLGIIREYNPNPERSIQQSQAVVGTRGLSSLRPGNYTQEGDMTVEADLTSIGLFLWQTLSDVHDSEGTVITGILGSTVQTATIKKAATIACVDGTSIVKDDFIQIGAGGLGEVAKVKSIVATLKSGAVTTLTATAAKGATTIGVTSATGIAQNDFLTLGTGDGLEVVKVSNISGTTLTVDALRKAHATGAAAVEVQGPFTITPTQPLRKAHATTDILKTVAAPFTHIVNKGTKLPPGLSLLLGMTDIGSYVLTAGSKINTFDFSVTPDDLVVASLGTLARSSQAMEKNLFGTPTKIASIPYAHWEATITVGSAALVDNLLRSLSLNFPNNLTAPNVVGTPHPGQIGAGMAEVSATFTTQFESQKFSKLVRSGVETPVTIKFEYTRDNNHSLEFYMPQCIFHGTNHPGISGQGEVEADFQFTAKIDTTQTPETDVRVTIKNNQWSMWDITEAETT